MQLESLPLAYLLCFAETHSSAIGITVEADTMFTNNFTQWA